MELKQSNFNEADFKDNYKNECQQCGIPIEMNWDYYWMHGNYCQGCDRKDYYNRDSFYKEIGVYPLKACK
jgi:hypothetical protein